MFIFGQNTGRCIETRFDELKFWCVIAKQTLSSQSLQCKVKNVETRVYIGPLLHSYMLFLYKFVVVSNSCIMKYENPL